MATFDRKEPHFGLPKTAAAASPSTVGRKRLPRTPIVALATTPTQPSQDRFEGMPLGAPASVKTPRAPSKKVGTSPNASMAPSKIPSIAEAEAKLHATNSIAPVTPSASPATPLTAPTPIASTPDADMEAILAINLGVEEAPGASTKPKKKTATKKRRVVGAPTDPAIEAKSLKDLEEARSKLAEAHAKENAQRTWKKLAAATLSLGLLGRKDRREAKEERERLQRRWVDALRQRNEHGLGSSLAEIRARVDNKERHHLLKKEREGAVARYSDKEFLKRFNVRSQRERGRLLKDRVVVEIGELHKRQVELLSPSDKSLARKLFEGYAARMPKNKYARIGVSVLAGTVVSTASVAAASLFVPYMAPLALGSAAKRLGLGLTGAAVGEVVGAAVKRLLKFEQKEKAAELRKGKVVEDIGVSLGKGENAAGESFNTADAVDAYLAITEQNAREARMRGYALLATKLGVAAAFGLSAGTALAEVPAKTPDSGASSVPNTPPSGLPERGVQDQTAEAFRFGAEPLKIPEKGFTPPSAGAESQTVRGSFPAVAPDVIPGREVVAPKLFTEAIVAPQGSNVWSMTERAFVNDPAFAALNRAGKDYFLDSYTKALQVHVDTLSSAQKTAAGFPTGKVGEIFAGKPVDLSFFDNEELKAKTLAAVEKLTREQEENILRYRGLSVQEIAAELAKPRAGTPAAAAPSMPTPTQAPPAAKPEIPTAPLEPEPPLPPAELVGEREEVAPANANNQSKSPEEPPLPPAELAGEREEKSPVVNPSEEPPLPPAELVGEREEVAPANANNQSKSPEEPPLPPAELFEYPAGAPAPSEPEGVEEIGRNLGYRNPPDIPALPVDAQDAPAEIPAPSPQELARTAAVAYQQDLEQIMGIPGGLFSQPRSGLLRFESTFGWRGGATFLSDKMNMESLAGSVNARGESVSKLAERLESLRTYMRNGVSAYNIDVGNKSVKDIMKEISAAQAAALTK